MHGAEQMLRWTGPSPASGTTSDSADRSEAGSASSLGSGESSSSSATADESRSSSAGVSLDDPGEAPFEPLDARARAFRALAARPADSCPSALLLLLSRDCNTKQVQLSIPYCTGQIAEGSRDAMEAEFFE